MQKHFPALQMLWLNNGGRCFRIAKMSQTFLHLFPKVASPKKYTAQTLTDEGYTIENAQITNVSLSTTNYCCLSLDLTLKAAGWDVVYGGYCLGKVYPDSYEKDSYEGSAIGMEAIMRIMDVVGVSRLEDMKGKYIRVATKGLGSTVKIIGNIINNRWFDYDSFFKDKESTSSADLAD